MGGSHSKTHSEQSAEVYLTQQFSGSCNVSCQNVINHVTIDIINSTVGGSVELTQSCATNASCIIGSNMGATADVLFKATNSSNAKNAWSAWSLDPFNFDHASAESRQDIFESISQSSSETCNISSYNQMDNITIFVADSTIGGDISISQNASTEGQCQLTNTMTAAAYATGIAQNTAASGKDKKGQKFGNKSQMLMVVVYGVVIIAIIIAVSIAAKIITNSSRKGKETAVMKKVIQARAAAGCPGGMKPILDKTTGKPIIDPRTLKPICPYPPLPKASKTPIDITVKEVFPGQTKPASISATTSGPAKTRMSSRSAPRLGSRSAPN